ncbi:L,D-transpeptidase [Rhodovulum sp. 12E13]|uniref:L,D-transpeptidase n=1 Tax=Rhodovulum sp. 12E13 TaxID=2203891 RepID=UPI000E19353E|nr:L,D-transpeptidase [Rhodovulum sp. 12E13]RDC71479.1 L,D-transpeptidase [Rhodovulum sp. 12E13]
MPFSALVSRALVVTLLTAAASGAMAELRISIDLSDQAMHVVRDGTPLHVWPVSTARDGKCTPVGTYHPVTLKRMHYSTLYGGAPMPFSIFFSGNYAIHGTTETDRLGSRASAGCVRLHPANAETLFGYVLDEGKAATTIVIRP